MNPLEQKLKQAAQEFRLSKEERAGAWDRILIRTGRPPTKSLVWRVFFVRGVAALLIVVLVGSGTAFAAEDSLPGDFLYPLKVSVTEPARAALLPTKEKASFNAERVAKRVKEAQTLASRAALSGELEREIEEELQELSDEADQIARTLEQDDPEEAERIATEYDSELETHADILEEVGKDSGSEGTRRASFALALKLREGSFRFWRLREETRLAVDTNTEAAAPSVEEPVALMMSAPAEEVAPTNDAPDMPMAKVAPQPEEEPEDEKLGERAIKRLFEALEKTEEELEEAKDSLDEELFEKLSKQVGALRERIEVGITLRAYASTLAELARVRTWLDAGERFKERRFFERAFEHDEDFRMGGERDILP